MRLVTFDAGDGDRVGVVRGEPGSERVTDVGELLGERDLTMNSLIARGGLDGAASVVDGVGVPLDRARLRAPVPRPGKIVAVGRNYREHAAEEGAAVTAEPLLFAKFPSSVVGHGEPVRWHADLSDQVDYEAELGVVIGRRTRDVTVEEALDAVFGYTCLNDLSARDLQVRDGQWVRAKSLDTFCPMGPWIVTADAVPDPGALAIRCLVNGELRQDATTAELIHGVAELIAHCSQSFTLEPGDVIATGTPGGVGAFREPPVYLRDGDIVEVWIEGVGSLVNRCDVSVAQ